jgi:Ca-activated chloride channel family protein
MERRLAIRNIVMTAAACLLPNVKGQQHDAQDQDFVIHSDVRLVLLDVSVKDPDGSFVEGLSQNNFEVFENNARQTISTFSNNDLPFTVGILVDESRSMIPKRNDVLAAAGLLIAESNPRDEVFVLNFNDTVKRGLPDGVLFSDDMKQLRAALGRARPQGMTALNDAVVEGLKQLELGRRDKKGLIVVSDGGDNASQCTRQKMLDMVERSIATIYTIGLFEPGDPDRDPGILKRLAKVSGGVASFPLDSTKMPDVCRAIARDMRTRYTIGYVPSSRNGGSLRHIRVHVSAPGHSKLLTLNRTTYRYDETQDQAHK